MFWAKFRAITTWIQSKPWQLSLVLFTLYFPLFIKVLHVEKFVYSRTLVRGTGLIQVLVNDGWIYMILSTLFYLSFVIKLHVILRSILRFITLFCVFIYTTDVLVIKNFNSHLVLSDLVKYSTYTPQYIMELFQNHVLLLLLILCILGSLITLFMSVTLSINTRFVHKFYIMIVTVLLLCTLTIKPDKYVHAWIYQNVWSYNQMVYSESVAYSTAFKSKLQQIQSKPSQCRRVPTHTSNNSKAKPAIIFLMVESLSAYQSKLFSHIKDWTPRLDEIAKKHVALTNFYANGFTTEDGEISLLTGHNPVYKPASFTRGGGVAFHGFFNLADSLPKVLKPLGYTSDFLTSADLGFSKTRDWAHSIGFEYTEGHEHPFYNQWKRYQFKAAPDEALMQRILQRVAYHSQQEQPWFLFAKTVTSHHPFINPDTGKKSEENNIRYVDRQIGTFYDDLVKKDFFKNGGILIITGDHHAMIPIKNEEIESLGRFRASARIPAMIASKNHYAHRYADPLQQIDLYQGIKNYVSDQLCTSEWRGDALHIPPIAAEWIIHRRGDQRDKISVFKDQEEYLIELNGDHTRLLLPHTLEANMELTLLNKINHLRTQLLPTSSEVD